VVQIGRYVPYPKARIRTFNTDPDILPKGKKFRSANSFLVNRQIFFFSNRQTSFCTDPHSTFFHPNPAHSLRIRHFRIQQSFWRIRKSFYNLDFQIRQTILARVQQCLAPGLFPLGSATSFCGSDTFGSNNLSCGSRYQFKVRYLDPRISSHQGSDISGSSTFLF